MPSEGSSAMDDAAVAAYVGRGGTGVLSLAAGDHPYATPVSYGFDPDDRAFYLRLGFRDGSEKARFVETTAEARLVIYGRDASAWTSVVAVGPLAPVEDRALTPEIATTLREGELPLFELWDEPTEALSFEIYRLDAERLTGRTTGDAG